MRVAIYVRVSTVDKGQDTENQLRELRQYCETRGYVVVQVYTDNESGRKGRAERSGFDSIFKDARRRKFDLVLFWALDRFSREGLAQTIHYLRQLEDYGVAFHSFTEDYLSSTENALVKDILLTLLAHFARLEAEKISQRTIAGLRRAKEKGKRLGRPSKLDRILPIVRDLHGSGLSVPELTFAVSSKSKMKVSEATIRRCLKTM